MDLVELIGHIVLILFLLLLAGLPILFIISVVNDAQYDTAVSECLVRGYKDAIKYNGTWVCVENEDPRHADVVPVFIPIVTGR